MEKCKNCDDTGLVIVANGADDFDEDFCSCSIGVAMLENQQAEEFKMDEAWRKGDGFYPPFYNDFTEAK